MELGGDSATWPSAQKTRAQSRAIEHERPRSKPWLFSRAVRRREPPVSAKQRHSRPWQIVSAHDDAGSSKQPQLPLRRSRGHDDARSAGLARPPRARRAHRALTRRERRAAARARAGAVGAENRLQFRAKRYWRRRLAAGGAVFKKSTLLVCAPPSAHPSLPPGAKGRGQRYEVLLHCPLFPQAKDLEKLLRSCRQ